jgi:hypothetical protein
VHGERPLLSAEYEPAVHSQPVAGLHGRHAVLDHDVDSYSPKGHLEARVDSRHASVCGHGVVKLGSGPIFATQLVVPASSTPSARQMVVAAGVDAAMPQSVVHVAGVAP